ncbi:MotA/TolQ/ExbB proton channel family protein [Shewanella sp. Isolate13]|uniref:MotA/TolQ/ExbB proton channel family protein n=1 Tax=Shewanella sp. Isolate13 TaxID=2908531 RepID=UPI001EFE89F3|nr:MotA/TolQ/ExbB proton channel family protein [Shewanella sp. Isolate13]MCG9728612.1 MotA/TolQ/ExbB proton channel family protein [Shewanella sp. Isolate13]
MSLDNMLFSARQFAHAILGFIELGGIVMWPLFICCLWMLWLVSRALFKEAGLSQQLMNVATQHDWLNQRLSLLALRQAQAQQYADLQGVKLLAMVAPLLGLLGTVSGMIAMFDAGASYGFHDPAVISAGISMAMVTTQTGLFVGLTGAVLAFFWQRKLNRVDTDLLAGDKHA